jgi:hypothetical protein
MRGGRYETEPRNRAVTVRERPLTTYCNQTNRKIIRTANRGLLAAHVRRRPRLSYSTKTPFFTNRGKRRAKSEKDLDIPLALLHNGFRKNFGCRKIPPRQLIVYENENKNKYSNTAMTVL